MYKAIIIDDEEMARTLLFEMLKEYCTNIDVVDLCKDLPTGVKSIRKNKPDLVFLDIEMLGHSGLELLDFFDKDDINFSIIFVTAYSRYAV
jgi:two-component system LytT family response regulator